MLCHTRPGVVDSFIRRANHLGMTSQANYAIILYNLFPDSTKPWEAEQIKNNLTDQDAMDPYRVVKMVMFSKTLKQLFRL